MRAWHFRRHSCSCARKRFLHSIAVGRQEWDFGDGLILGRDPWSPLSRNFDGVLATLRAAPARVRLFVSTLRDRNEKPNVEDLMAGFYAEGSEVPAQLYGIGAKRRGTSNIASSSHLQARYGQRASLPRFLWPVVCKPRARVLKSEASVRSVPRPKTCSPTLSMAMPVRRGMPDRRRVW